MRVLLLKAYCLQHVSSQDYSHLLNPGDVRGQSSEGTHESVQTAPRKVSIDFLDMGGELVTDQPTGPQRPALYLKPSGPSSGGFSLTPQSFQQMWSTLPGIFNGPLCALSTAPSTAAEIASLMATVDVCSFKRLLYVL